jgi:hypothetical protein
MPRPTCRYCDQPIRWVRTESGSEMPINAAPDRNGNVVLVPDGVGHRARVLAGKRLLEWRGQLWMPHFVTCANMPSPIRPRRTRT